MSSEYERIKREVMARRERSSSLHGLIEDSEHQHMLDRLKAQEMSLNKQSMSIRSMLVRMSDDNTTHDISSHIGGIGMDRTVRQRVSPTRIKSNQTALDSIRRLERSRGDHSRVDFDTTTVPIATTSIALDITTRFTRHLPMLEEKEASKRSALPLQHLQEIIPLPEDDPLYQAQYELQRLRQHREHTLQERIQKQSEAVKLMEKLRQESIEKARRDRNFQVADDFFRKLHQTHTLQVLRHIVRVHKIFHKMKLRIQFKQQKASFVVFKQRLQHRQQRRLKGFFYEIKFTFQRMITALRQHQLRQEDKLKQDLIADRCYYSTLAKKALQDLKWTKRHQQRSLSRARKYHIYRLLQAGMHQLSKHYRRTTKPKIVADLTVQVFLRDKFQTRLDNMWACLQWNVRDSQSYQRAVEYHQESILQRAWRQFTYTVQVNTAQRQHIHFCSSFATLTLKRRYFQRLLKKIARFRTTSSVAEEGVVKTIKTAQQREQVSKLRLLHRDKESILSAYFQVMQRRLLQQKWHRNKVSRQFEKQLSRKQARLYALVKAKISPQQPLVNKQMLQQGVILLMLTKLWTHWKTTSYHRLHHREQYQALHRNATKFFLRKQFLHLQHITLMLAAQKRNINDKCRLRRFDHIYDQIHQVFVHLQANRSKRQQIRVFAQNHYNRCRQKTFFDYIHLRLLRKYQLKKRMEEATYWSRLRRGYLLKWRMHTMLRKHTHQLVNTKRQATFQRMKKLCLQEWRTLASDHKVEGEHYRGGQLHWRQRRLRKAFKQIFNATFKFHHPANATTPVSGKITNVSIAKLSKGNKDEANLLLLQPAWQVRDKRLVLQKKMPLILVKRCFRQFRSYHQQQVILPRARRQQGKQRHERTLLRQGWQAWYERYQHHVERHNWIGYYRINIQMPLLQRRFFRQLVRQRQQRVVDQEVEQIGVDQYVRSCARVLLREWKARIQHKLRYIQPQYNDAKQLHRRHLLQQGLQQLMSFTSKSATLTWQTKRARYFQAVTRSLQPAWRFWRLFATNSQHLHNVWELAKQHHSKLISRLFFTAMTHLKQTQTTQRKVVNKGKQHFFHKLTRKYFLRFLHKCRFRKRHRHHKQLARAFRDRHIVSMIFHKGFKVIYKQYVIENAQIMSRASSQFLQALKKRYVKKWQRKIYHNQQGRQHMQSLELKFVIGKAFKQLWYTAYFLPHRHQHQCMQRSRRFYMQHKCRLFLSNWRFFVQRKKANIRHIISHEVFQSTNNSATTSFSVKSAVLLQAKRKHVLMSQKEQERLHGRKRTSSGGGDNSPMPKLMSLSAHNLHTTSSKPASSMSRLVEEAGISDWMRGLSKEEVLHYKEGFKRHIRRMHYYAKTTSYHGNKVQFATDALVPDSAEVVTASSKSNKISRQESTDSMSLDFLDAPHSAVTSAEVLLLLSSRVLCVKYWRHWLSRKHQVLQRHSGQYKHAIEHHKSYLKLVFLQRWCQKVVDNVEITSKNDKKAAQQHLDFQRRQALTIWRQFTTHQRLHVHVERSTFHKQYLHMFLWRWKMRTKSNVSMPALVVGGAQQILTRTRGALTGSRQGHGGQANKKKRQAAPALTYDCLFPMLAIQHFLQLRNGASSMAAVDSDGDVRQPAAAAAISRVYYARQSQAYNVEEIAEPYYINRQLRQGFAHLLQLTRLHRHLKQKASRFHQMFSLRHAWAEFRTNCDASRRVNKLQPSRAEIHQLYRMRSKALRVLFLNRAAVKLQARHRKKQFSKLWHAWYVASRKQLKLRRSISFIFNHHHLRTLKQAWNSWHADTLVERSIELHMKHRQSRALHYSLHKFRAISRSQYKLRMKLLHGIMQRRRLSVTHAGVDTVVAQHPPNALQILKKFRGTSLWKYCQHASFHVKQRTLKKFLHHLANQYAEEEKKKKCDKHHKQSMQRDVIKHLYHLRRNRIAQQFCGRAAFKFLRNQVQSMKIRKIRKALSLVKSQRCYQGHCLRQWHAFTVSKVQQRQALTIKLRTNQLTIQDLKEDYYYLMQRKKFTFFKLQQLFFLRLAKEKKNAFLDEFYIQSKKRRGLRHFLHRLKHDIRVKRNQHVLSLMEKRMQCKRALKLWYWKHNERFLKAQIYRLHDPFYSLAITDGVPGPVNAKYNSKLKRAFQHIHKVVQSKKTRRLLLAAQQQNIVADAEDTVGSFDHTEDIPEESVIESDRDVFIPRATRRAQSRERKLDREHRRLQQYSLQ